MMMHHSNQIVFDIEPVPAPRMTRSDKWKTDPNHYDPKKRQRKCVADYFAYKTAIKVYSLKYKYQLTPELNIVFVLSMPASWSKKKREKMNGKPHQSRPDIDNLVKGFMDSMSAEDGFVWNLNAKKYWGEKGEIVILK